jgi:hypothetical protein
MCGPATARKAGSLVSRYRPTLEEYAREARWLEQCRGWALPIAGSLSAVILGTFLWALWALSDALL